MHLGRLSRYYQKCLQCKHRDETGLLSKKTVRSLQRTSQQHIPVPLMHKNGFRGRYLNEMDRHVTQNLAGGFAMDLVRKNTSEYEAVIVLGHDDRPSAPDLSLGCAEGLRRVGCKVLNIGPATEACLRYHVRYHEADGGVFVGGGDQREHINGLSFFGSNGHPVTEANGLQRIWDQHLESHTMRRRHWGAVQHFQAVVPYVASLLRFYHALRPLRIVMEVASTVLRTQVERVFKETPCVLTWIHPERGLRSKEVLPTVVKSSLESSREDVVQSKRVSLRWSQRQETIWNDVVANNADLGVAIDNEERIFVFDEKGRKLNQDTHVSLLASMALQRQTSRTVVVPEEFKEIGAKYFKDKSVDVVSCATDSSEIWTEMKEHCAVLGIGGYGRFWFQDSTPVSDPLVSLAITLASLSVTDQPISEVVGAV